MITVDVHPEFGIELALALPYAYWLHENDQLEKVIVSKGMKPFYYFCDDVREDFTQRTIDNGAAGLNELPNNWIHGINPEARETNFYNYAMGKKIDSKQFYHGDFQTYHCYF